MKEHLTWDNVIPLGTSPILVFALRYAKLFDLQPLGHWSFPVLGLVILSAMVGAFVANFYPKKNIKYLYRVLPVVGAFLIVLLGVQFYHYFYENPPREESVGEYDCLSFVAYFLMVYFPLGFCLAHVAKVFLPSKPIAGDEREKTESRKVSSDRSPS